MFEILKQREHLSSPLFYGVLWLRFVLLFILVFLFCIVALFVYILCLDPNVVRGPGGSMS